MKYIKLFEQFDMYNFGQITEDIDLSHMDIMTKCIHMPSKFIDEICSQLPEYKFKVIESERTFLRAEIFGGTKWCIIRYLGDYVFCVAVKGPYKFTTDLLYILDDTDEVVRVVKEIIGSNETY